VQTVVAIAAVSLGFRVQAVTLPGFDSVNLPLASGVLARFGSWESPMQSGDRRIDDWRRASVFWLRR
jgi:hypothetical protein